MRDLVHIVHLLGIIVSLGSMTTFIIIRKDIARINGHESDFALQTIRKFLKIAYVGMLIMLFSGAYLALPYLPSFASMVWLHAKILTVVLWFLSLVGLSINLKRAKPETYLSYDMNIGIFSFLSVVLGIVVVAFAIFAFD